MKKNRAIVLGVTSNWAFACGTFLIGLKKYSPDIADNIIVYHDGISDSDKSVMQKICSNVIFLEYNEEYFKQKLSMEKIHSTKALQRYSIISFALYEIFDLLHQYHQVLWLDADILIQKNIADIFEYTNVSLTKSIVNLNDSIGINVSTIANIDGKKIFYNSGLVLVNDSIDFSPLTDECYKYTAKLYDTLMLPDQAVLSLVLELNKIPVNIFEKDVICAYNSIHSCDVSFMIHGVTSIGKFWSDTVSSHIYFEWRENYNEWVQLNGTLCENKKITSTHIVKDFKKSSLLTHFRFYKFWNSLYDKIRFEIPAELKPNINCSRNYFQFNLHNCDKSVHYEFVYINNKEIKICFHIENTDLAASFSTQDIELNHQIFKYFIARNHGKLSIEARVNIENTSDALTFLFTKTYGEICTAFQGIALTHNSADLQYYRHIAAELAATNSLLNKHSSSLMKIEKALGVCAENVNLIKAAVVSDLENSLQFKFKYIYDNNKWGKGSGSGSNPDVTIEYRKFIENFLRERCIKSVNDIGCGDWQFSKFIDWNTTEYNGYDVYEKLVNDNHLQFSNEKITFHLYDGDFSKLPNADLCIIKDVLQHLPNSYIKHFLSTLDRYKYVLISNNFSTNITENMDAKVGGCRCLDIRKPPFSVDCTEIFRIHRPRNNDIVTFLWINNGC